MPIIAKPGNGVLVPTSSYKRIKGFQGGAYYWEQQPQSIIRQYLGDFLPPVEATKEGPESYGWFRRFVAGKEVLCQSKPLAGRRIPSKQLHALEKGLDELRRVAESEETGPHNRDLVRQFRLPNPAIDPELYRLRGLPWNRHLEILWGCEKSEDTSLPPTAAVQALQKDRIYPLKRLLWLILGLLLLLLALLLLSKCGQRIGVVTARFTDRGPTLLTSIEAKNDRERTLLLDLVGSDPDSAITKYQVDWGDGTKSVAPGYVAQVKKQFQKDGSYTIRAIAVDDQNKESLPSEQLVSFDYEAQEKVAAEKQRIEKERVLAEDAARQLAVAEKERLRIEAQKQREAEEHAQALAAEQEKKQQEKERQQKELEAKKAELEAKEQLPVPTAANSDSQPGSSNVPMSPNEFRDTSTGRRVRAIKFEKPKYPGRALNDEQEGSVGVTFVVAKDGTTKDLKVVRETNGYYFKQAVLDSIRAAKFQPATVDGQPVEQTLGYEITFKIDR